MWRVGMWRDQRWREHVERLEMWRVEMWCRIAMELLRQGDVWVVEIARNPVFSRIKGLPASRGLCD
jgi:hypothetical protein